METWNMEHGNKPIEFSFFELTTVKHCYLFTVSFFVALKYDHSNHSDKTWTVILRSRESTPSPHPHLWVAIPDRTGVAAHRASTLFKMTIINNFILCQIEGIPNHSGWGHRGGWWRAWAYGKGLPWTP
jgi:hypothetical protein